MKKKHGANYPTDSLAQTELARINPELKWLKSQIGALEERKSKPTAGSLK